MDSNYILNKHMFKLARYIAQNVKISASKDKRILKGKGRMKSLYGMEKRFVEREESKRTREKKRIVSSKDRFLSRAPFSLLHSLLEPLFISCSEMSVLMGTERVASFFMFESIISDSSRFHARRCY